jgi:hypothetical protein
MELLSAVLPPLIQFKDLPIDVPVTEIQSEEVIHQ